MLNVKITIDDGKGKKAEIEISEADNLSKLVVIDNVFKLFGIDTDILSMVEDYNKIGKMYSSFFNQVESIEADALEKIDKNKNEIKEKLTQAYEDNKEEIETTYKEVNDQPEYIRTGIKYRDDGKPTYRLHYKCIACYNRGTHYIYQESKTTWCHRCNHEMMVHPAHPEGFPNQDNFGNFFRSGDFYDWNLWKNNPQ